jgi:hypothetical protein
LVISSRCGSRARLWVEAALLTALVVVAGPAAAPSVWAQERRRLPELEDERDRALESWSRVDASLRRQEQRLGEIASLHQALVAEEAGLQEQAPGFLRDRELEAKRQELRRVSAERAGALREQGRLSRQELIARRELIATSHPWVARLFELAERARRAGRDEQAEGYANTALDELEFLEDLEELDEELGYPLELPDLEEETEGLTAEELGILIEIYREPTAEAHDQVAWLEPEHRRLTERLQHLDRLAQAGFALPTLQQRIDRTRESLGIVSDLLAAAQDDLQRCEERLEALEQLQVERSMRGRPDRR